MFLAARLHAQSGCLPAPRKFTPEQLNAWIAEDEADATRISVTLFLDASVLLAASGSARGASRDRSRALFIVQPIAGRPPVKFIRSGFLTLTVHRRLERTDKSGGRRQCLPLVNQGCLASSPRRTA